MAGVSSICNRLPLAAAGIFEQPNNGIPGTNRPSFINPEEQ
jgi:hypothetical protein